MNQLRDQSNFTFHRSHQAYEQFVWYLCLPFVQSQRSMGSVDETRYQIPNSLLPHSSSSSTAIWRISTEGFDPLVEQFNNSKGRINHEVASSEIDASARSTVCFRVASACPRSSRRTDAPSLPAQRPQQSDFDSTTLRTSYRGKLDDICAFLGRGTRTDTRRDSNHINTRTNSGSHCACGTPETIR